MSYLALYRKWRPLVFKDVVEQEHVVKTLKNSVETGRIAHAYLFCGTRGTGKTTMAKIFSRAINCLQPHEGDPCNECEICKGVLAGNIMDVIEMDAASNNSVDNVREICDEVVYAPSKAKHKVYIIDEVHMLSTGAFNALLKTLEEPPSHVVFILATTEPHKLPATILSRCQRFDFRRIPIDSIAKRISHIAASSEVTIEEDGIRLIAKMADGALRDAISILDQCISIGKKHIVYEDVLSVIGIVNDTFISDVIDAISHSEIDKVLMMVETLVSEGKNITQFVSDMINYYRNLLICSAAPNPQDIIDLPKEGLKIMQEQSKRFERVQLMSIIKDMSLVEADLRWSTHPRILLETSLIKLCENKYNVEDMSLEDRILSLEKKLSDFLKNGVSYNPGISGEGSESKKEKGNIKHPSVKKAGKSAGSIAGLEVWDSVLKELKQNGRMVLYTNLMDTKVIELSDKIVGIVFKKGSSFNKMSVSRVENIEVVEELLSGKMGKDVKIKCVDEDDTVEKKEEDKDDLIEKAQDIANKLNATLNIIDE